MGSAFSLTSMGRGYLFWQTKEANQAQRLLALASINDGGSCVDAARLCDCACCARLGVRFNERGPDG